MTRFTWRDVLDATGAVPLSGVGERSLAGVCTDTRTLRPGELFLALRGPNFDGNRFAAKALAAGAGGLLLREDAALGAEGLSPDRPVAVHPEPRRALADLAGWYRSTLEVPVIGVTGSCGKTTTKDIVRELFAPLFGVVASPSSFNNEIGVPLSILLAERDTRMLCLEMGTSHPGEIAALSRIARPSAGIITNIGAAHLEGLGTMEGVAREKGDLAAAVPREGFVVLNADCRFTPAVRERTTARVITFSIEGGPAGSGVGERGDLDATELLFHSGGTTFRLGEREVTTPLLGTHNVQNLLAALSVALGLEIDLDRVLPQVATLHGGRQRMERIELGDATLFDDTYNSNPQALRAAVRVLAGLHGYERRVLVLGDMLELGDLAAELHHRVGVEAARQGVDLLVLVGELARAAGAGALEAGLPQSAVVHFGGTDAAAEGIGSIVRAGDAVLVKGSRLLRMERIVLALTER